MAYVFQTLICPSEKVVLAREIVAAFGLGSDGMWFSGMSSDGLEPVLDYISSGYIDAELAGVMPIKTYEQVDGSWVLVSSTPGNPVEAYEVASSNGVVCTQLDVNEVWASLDVTVQEPFVAMGRLGLKMVNPSPIE